MLSENEIYDCLHAALDKMPDEEKVSIKENAKRLVEKIKTRSKVPLSLDGALMVIAFIGVELNGQTRPDTRPD